MFEKYKNKNKDELIKIIELMDKEISKLKQFNEELNFMLSEKDLFIDVISSKNDELIKQIDKIKNQK